MLTDIRIDEPIGKIIDDCIECGYLDPAGYCWNAAKDSDEERAARAIG